MGFYDHKIKFILKVDDDEIEVSSSMMIELASNKNGALGHFLAGYFKSYPTEDEMHAENEPWYKSDYGNR